MEFLPHTFRDAVMVTRSFGIRYLWIDALCIVQDDPEDWAKESAIMGQIYTNSWLTLISLRGKSCNDGLLDRKAAIKAPIYYKSSVKLDLNGIYWLWHPRKDYPYFRRLCGDFAPIAQDKVNSRWSSRGWTLQEERLSTRRLMFGTENEYYYCDKFLRMGVEDRFRMMRAYSKPFLDLLSNYSTPKDPYFLWYEVVATYAHTNLTYPTDRLPAVSGLARTIQQKTAGNYLAGLWQSNLFDGLLWIRVPWTRPVTSEATFIDSVVYPKHYTAPSWSWARSEQRINFAHRHSWCLRNVSEIEILEARTTLLGPNPFGGVQDGHILLRGKTFGLKEARIFFHDRMKVNAVEWVTGHKWLDAISHNGFEIARCALDWKTSRDTKDFELFESPWDQLMMMIIASHSIDNEDSEVDEHEEDKEDSEDEEGEGYEDSESDEAEEDEETENNENKKSNASIKSDDDIDNGDEDIQNKQDEADGTDKEEDEEDNSPRDPREYFGLLLLPSSEEADSWVRVGVFTLRNDKHGRAVLDNCSEKIVKLV